MMVLCVPEILPLINVIDLTKQYNGAPILEGVSFDLAEHSRTAILGPSGSGKTTLLRLLAGLELPEHGKIYMRGQVISQPGWARPPHQRSMGMVFQSPALWPHMTVAQNILFGLGDLSRSAACQRLEAVLAQCALLGLETRYPQHLSGGEARRVALARAIAPQPQILLLDEPLTNLDSDLRKTLLELLRTIASEVSILVHVTHDHREAEFLCERIWTIRDRQLVTGTTGKG
jgi:iron(III) transport system ATP-binding protein